MIGYMQDVKKHMYMRFNTKMIVMISRDEKCYVFIYFVKQYTQTLLFIIFSKN